MFKHIFWGVIVLTISFLAAYVGLTMAGYPKEAHDLGSAGVGLGGGILAIGFMSLFVY